MPTAQHIFWVRYEPRRALTRLLGLSPAAELAHRRLADSVWAGDGWPAADPLAAARLTRVPARSWPRVMAELRLAGWSCRRTSLYHPEVAAVISEAHATSKALREAGARGGKASVQTRQRAFSEGNPSSSQAQAELKPGSSQAQATLKPGSSQAQHSTVQKQNSTDTIKPVERLARSAASPKKGSATETNFMTELKETVTLFSPDAAELEQTNWGGWWRNRFREHPDKARRVLAEIRVMIKQGTIRKTPGAAAMDLWNRLP